MSKQNRILWIVIVGLILSVVLAIYAYLSLLQKQDDYKKLNTEYETSVSRAGDFMEAFSGNIKTVRALTDSMPFCGGNETFLDNASFDPPIPYFIDKTHISFAIDKIQLGANAKPLFLFPLIGMDRFPIMSKANDGNLTISFDHDLLHQEVKASDMAVIAVQGDGRLCKINMRLHAAKKLENEPSVPLRIFGRIGMEWGRFSLPYGTDIDQDRNTIMISDCTNGLIQEFDFKGNLIRIVGENSDGDLQLSRPADVKINHGKVFVVEERAHQYQVFDRDGKAISRHGVHKRLEKKNYADYVFGEDPVLDNPLGIAVDKDKNIFVVDYGNYRIQKLDPEGKVLKVFGGQTMYEGKAVDSPYYIDINDELERVYIVDRGNDRITVFDLNGEFLFAFGGSGSGDGELDYPHEVDVAPDGRVFVADTNNRRIQIFDTDGKYIDQIVTGYAYGVPKTVAVSKDGYVITGHLGGDAYMAVWPDPMSAQDRAELKVQLRNYDVPEAADLKIKKANIERSFDRTVYQTICASCHSVGALGAPRTKNTDDWDRFPRNLSALLALAKQGKGAMIPKGGCTDCTDEELLEAIKYMLPDTWGKEGASE